MHLRTSHSVASDSLDYVVAEAMESSRENNFGDAEAMQAKTLQHNHCLYLLHACSVYTLPLGVMDCVRGVCRQRVSFKMKGIVFVGGGLPLYVSVAASVLSKRR